jgi:hypothetical protein
MKLRQFLKIADKTIANAIKNGISEHYDSVSGQPLGVGDYCMSCTLVTMMLDVLRETVLELHETDGPVLDLSRESAARAFGALYEKLARQARAVFKSKPADER